MTSTSVLDHQEGAMPDDHTVLCAALVAEMLGRHDLDAERVGEDVVVHLPTTDFTLTAAQIDGMAATAATMREVCGIGVGQAFAAQLHVLVGLINEVVATGRDHLLGAPVR